MAELPRKVDSAILFMRIMKRQNNIRITKKALALFLAGVFLLAPNLNEVNSSGFAITLGWTQEERLFSAGTGNDAFSSGPAKNSKLAAELRTTRPDFKELYKAAAICRFIEKEGIAKTDGIIYDVSTLKEIVKCLREGNIHPALALEIERLMNEHPDKEIVSNTKEYIPGLFKINDIRNARIVGSGENLFVHYRQHVLKRVQTILDLINKKAKDGSLSISEEKLEFFNEHFKPAMSSLFNSVQIRNLTYPQFEELLFMLVNMITPSLYDDIKKESNARGMEIYDSARKEIKRLEENNGWDEAFKRAIIYAALGNGLEAQYYDKSLLNTAGIDERLINIDGFLKDMLGKIEAERGGTILYFLDNAGEIFLDLLVVELLLERGFNVKLAAKERPTTDDLTMVDVEKILSDLQKSNEKEYQWARDLKVASSGSRTPATDFNKVKPELFEGAIFSIYKGGGNHYGACPAVLTSDSFHIFMIKEPLQRAILAAEGVDKAKNVRGALVFLHREKDEKAIRFDTLLKDGSIFEPASEAEEGENLDGLSLEDIRARLPGIKKSFERIHLTISPHEIIIEIPDEGMAVRYFDPTKANVITPYSNVSKLQTKVIAPRLNRQIIYRIKALSSNFEKLLAIGSASEITGIVLDKDKEKIIDEIKTEISNEINNNDNRHIIEILKATRMKVKGEAQEEIDKLTTAVENDGEFDYKNLAYQAIVSIVRSWPKRHWHAHIGESIHEGFIWNEMVLYNRDLFLRFGKTIDGSDLSDDKKDTLKNELRRQLGAGKLWQQLSPETKRSISELFTRFNLDRKIGIYNLESWGRAMTHVALEHFSDGVRDLRLLISINRKELKASTEEVIRYAISGFEEAERLARMKYGGNFSVKLVSSFARQNNDPKDVEQVLDEIIRLGGEDSNIKSRVIGIDISGAEAIIDTGVSTHFRKTSDYKNVIEKAANAGMVTMSHLGDWGNTSRATEAPKRAAEKEDKKKELSDIEDIDSQVRFFIEFLQDGIQNSGPLNAVLHGIALAPEGSIITKDPRKKKRPLFAGKPITDPLNLENIEKLLGHLRENNIEILTCPSVNVRTQKIAFYKGHPLHQWLIKGNKVSINVDDFYWTTSSTLSDDIVKMMLAAPLKTDTSRLTPRVAREITSATLFYNDKKRAIVDSGQFSDAKSIVDYIDKHKRLFKDTLADRKRDTLLRIPIEAIESIGIENIKDFLATFQEAPNGYIELYYMSGVGEVTESVYQKYGLQKKSLPKDFKRTRENTITLFPALKGEEIEQSTILSKLGSLDVTPEDTILSPIGLQHDPIGLIRATILGLKMMEIAREISEKGKGVIDQDFKDKIQLEILEQLKNVCDADDLKNFNLTPDDIIALATGNINNIITALKKLIRLLPITPIDAEELRRIYEHAKEVLSAA